MYVCIGLREPNIEKKYSRGTRNVVEKRDHIRRPTGSSCSKLSKWSGFFRSIANKRNDYSTSYCGTAEHNPFGPVQRSTGRISIRIYRRGECTDRESGTPLWPDGQKPPWRLTVTNRRADNIRMKKNAAVARTWLTDFYVDARSSR